jgi:hypothetical protein
MEKDGEIWPERRHAYEVGSVSLSKHLMLQDCNNETHRFIAETFLCHISSCSSWHVMVSRPFSNLLKLPRASPLADLTYIDRRFPPFHSPVLAQLLLYKNVGNVRKPNMYRSSSERGFQKVSTSRKGNFAGPTGHLTYFVEHYPLERRASARCGRLLQHE